MASFSVDVTDIVFAGGRTGSKTVTISNGPSGGITAVIRGTNSTYFRTAVVESGVSYTISTKQANDTGSTRTAYVRFTNNNSSADYVDVNLQQYSVNDGMKMYVTGATDMGYGNYSVNVGSQMGSTEVLLDAAAGNGASGSVVSGSDWLSSVQGYPGISDTGFIRFNAAYITNTGSERSGQIQYTAAAGWVNTLTIVQEGDAPTEVLSVTPSSISYDAAGGPVSIAVTYRGSTYDCDYTDVSSWASVSLSSVMTGVLSGTVTAAPNTSTGQRSGNIVFSDTSGSINLPISQLGRAVTLSVDKSELNYTSSGGSKTLAVTFADTLSTNAASMPNWLQQSYVTVDDSHRTYTITASKNNTSSSRSFDFNLADVNMSLTVPITQAGGTTPTPQLTISPQGDSVTASSGQISIYFAQVAYSGLDFNSVTYVISDDSWITYVGRNTSTTSTNYGHMYFNYTANSGANDRTATITFSAPNYASVTYTLVQAGTGVVQLLVSPPSSNVNYRSGTLYVSVRDSEGQHPNISYNITDSWVRVSQQYPSIGSYTFSYDLNFSTEPRTAVITFSAPGYDPVIYVINQSGAPGDIVSFSPNVMEFNYLGGKEDRGEILSITRNGYSGTIYARYTGDSIPVNYSSTIQGYSDYLTFGMPAGSRNDTYTDLTGKIEWYNAQTGGEKVGEIQVIWRGAPKQLTVFPDVLAFFNGSILRYRQLEVSVSAVGEVSVTAPSWLNVTLVEENSTYKRYRVRCYSAGNGQDGYIVFTSGGNSALVYVKCLIADRCTTAPMPIKFPLSGGSKNIMFSSISDQYNPQIDSYPSWISWRRNFWESDVHYWFQLFKLTATSTSSSRSSQIEISFISSDSAIGTVRARVNVLQEGGVLSTSPQSMSFSSNGGTDTASVTFTGNLIVDSSIPDWLDITEVSSETGQKVYTVNVLRNTGDERSYNILFQDDNGMITLPIVQEVGAPAIVVSPTSNVVGENQGTISITVYGPQGINCNISGNWMRLSSHSGNTYTFTYDANSSGSSRSATATFTATGYLPATYTLTQAAGASLTSNPTKLKFHKNAATKKISFSNVPSGQVDYTITYIDDSGWLSVSGNGLLKDVSVLDNYNGRRRAEIKFSDHNNSSNYVVVPVIQGGDGYDAIWMDTLYYPVNRDTDGNYYYRIVDQNSNEEYFRGIAAKPQGWGGNVGGIDVPRLVEDHLHSDFVETNSLTSWDEMKGYCTVDIYNMTASGYPGVVDETFKYWNDWSGYEEMYDYTVCINDPINGRGCDNMIIPFCVYYDDSATFRIVQTSQNGNVITNTLPTPTYPFVMTYGSFNYLKKLEFKQDDDVMFSYDMMHCGPGAFVYRNRFGGWDSFLVEGNISKKDDYTKQNYRKKGEYNSRKIYRFDEKVTDSVNINTTYEAYTGWLTDEQAERLAFHLLSSPLVYFQNFTGDLYDTDQFTLIPVRITASSAEYKKFRNGKRLVNYLITFEKGYTEKVRN